MLKKFSAAGALALVLCSLVFAQTTRKEAEAKLKQVFEGKKVIVKIDMPGTRDGVDIRPEKGAALDMAKYSRRLADFGTSIMKGETVVVTMVELGGDEVEFHLNGGGYGSGGDTSSEPVAPKYPQALPKSSRELELEESLKTETNRSRIDYLRSELRRERDRRERDDERAMNDYRYRMEERESVIRERRLRRGSRFHVRFSELKTVTITPEMLMGYLAEYVDFSPMNGATPTNDQPTKIDPLDDDRPYTGEWRNGRDEILRIGDTDLRFPDGSRIPYSETFRISDARAFVIEYVSPRTGAKTFVLIFLGDGDMKIRYFDSLADLQRGVNNRGEEVWRR